VPDGEARITRGYRLRARHVIHTVGPVWQHGNNDEDRLLASCYLSSLRLAGQHAISTIAFPAISTGVYGFPAERAATIAVKAVRHATEAGIPALTRVVFCCFDRRAADFHQAALDRSGTE